MIQKVNASNDKNQCSTDSIFAGCTTLLLFGDALLVFFGK